MKSLDFKRKGSNIRILNEETTKPKYNWDRVIYIIFLTVIILLLGYYFTNKVLFIKANGEVLYENVIVRLTDDCRILKYHTAEDKIIKVGDSLFTYSLDKENIWGGGGRGPAGNGMGEGTITQTNYSTAWDWVQKEKFSLQKSIGLNNIDIMGNQALIDGYTEELKRLENEVILDVLPRDHLQYATNQIKELRVSIEKLKRENEEFYGKIRQLDTIKIAPQVKSIKTGTFHNNGTGGNDGSDENDSIRVFYSPFDGTVTRIFTRQYEVALKSDQIMAIHKNTPMFVKGFFSQEDLNYFKVGDNVNIEFPDGSKSKGKISRFNYSTIQLPEEFQKRYEPTTRTIAADIYPLDTAEYVHWKAFYKLGVVITKFKY